MQLPSPVGATPSVPQPTTPTPTPIIVVNPVYGPVIALDLTKATTLTPVFQIVVTDGNAFQIASVAGPCFVGQRMRIENKNISGGAMGAVTWGAVFKQAAGTFAPANGFRRSVWFEYDGANWVMVIGSTGDTAN